MKQVANALFSLLFSISAYSTPNKAESVDTNGIIVDYLNIPGPIDFDSSHFDLAWSSHPNKNVYFQEYIPNQERLEHFNKMFLIQTFTIDSLKVEQLVDAKAVWLEERKKKDEICNYQILNNASKTRYIVDFVLSDTTKQTEIVEWNAYLYQYFSTTDGRKGLVLTGISIRGYGDTIAFLTSLPQWRKKEMAKLTKYHLPEITLP